MLNKVLLRDHEASRWLLFESPSEVLSASRIEDVPSTLAAVENRIRDSGSVAAGYLAYEAAGGFDKALRTGTGGGLPLLCFGLFNEPSVLLHLPAPESPIPADTAWTLSDSRQQYQGNIGRIKQQIALGNCYQVNYCQRQVSSGPVDPWQLFLHIAADAPYAAYLELAGAAIVSASPELFFQLDGTSLTCRPMKGTAARGMTLAADREAMQQLSSSEKNRAENVMIADMVRNDLGRIARPGSVTADSLYALEKYPTVWQITSTVRATSDAGIGEIISALFPPASITGAPKAASMSLIAKLEDAPRGIYTGSIGYFRADRKAQFSVAIRTAQVDTGTGAATYGVGGGIVWDSDADDEYDECLSKSRILSRSAADADFQLLETLRWTPQDGYFLLNAHLDRLQNAAEYFDFHCARTAVERALSELAATFSELSQRVRWLVDRSGEIVVTHKPLPEMNSVRPFRLRLASRPKDKNDPFLYHKTTRRTVYEHARQAVADCDDVLLWNSDGFVTETTIANLLLGIDGQLLTPPVECGLLAGTLREEWIRTGKVSEQKVHIDELANLGSLQLINSVRGLFPANLCR
jgi:para-aminobenzoate synthetase/4-amino-4-deoxychorismate lyase